MARQRHAWSMTTRSSTFIGCAPHSGLSIKLPCWLTKYYMGALRDTWVRWFQSPIYKAGGHWVLPAPIALWCLPSGSLSSVAGLSRLLLHASRTPCQRRRRQLSRWRHSLGTSSHGCQPVVSRPHHLICPLDCQTALCNTSNLEVAMLHRDLWLIDWLIDWQIRWCTAVHSSVRCWHR